VKRLSIRDIARRIGRLKALRVLPTGPAGETLIVVLPDDGTVPWEPFDPARPARPSLIHTFQPDGRCNACSELHLEVP
jgi:hypothetical protein